MKLAKDESLETGAPRRRTARRRKRPALRLLVVRHAIAGDKAEWARTGAPDAERPITKEGKRKMKRAARGLTAVVPEIRTLATSPLVRAAQTAEIVAKAYEEASRAPAVTRLSALAPGKSSNLLLGWLAEQPRGQTVAIVGHEPHLGQFVSWSLTGLRESFVELKKGAAALIEFPDEVRAGRAKTDLGAGAGATAGDRAVLGKMSNSQRHDVDSD